MSADYTWTDLYEPSLEEFEATARSYSLHPLVVEDVLESHQRPKLEKVDGMVLLVLKTACYDDPSESVEFGEIAAVVGENCFITVRHGSGTSLDDLRARLADEEQHTTMGAQAALHALLDKVVDDYEPVMEGLADDVNEVEEQLFSRTGGATERIYKLGRESLEFSRAVSPLVEPVARLAQGDVKGVDPALQTYFRDVYDHILRIHTQAEAMHELLSNLLQANLTQVTVQQNEDMRKISAWVAIAAIPTLLAGVWGMNFEHMPELRWELGYPAALLLMLVVCSFIWSRFKRAGWL